MRTETITRRLLTRLSLILTITAGIALTTGLIAPAGVGAQADASGKLCGNVTLRGDYGLLASGVRAVPPFLGGGTERIAATAMWTFHGDGTFTQGPGGSFHGEVTGTQPDPLQIPGTYAVNTNCTGTMQLHVPELPFPIEYGMVIVDSGREIKAVVVFPRSNVVTVELTRK